MNFSAQILFPHSKEVEFLEEISGPKYNVGKVHSLDVFVKENKYILGKFGWGSQAENVNDDF